MLPTQEEQDNKFEELYNKYKSSHKPMTWKVANMYAKWYVEKVIEDAAKVATVNSTIDNDEINYNSIEAIEFADFILESKVYKEDSQWIGKDCFEITTENLYKQFKKERNGITK